MFEGDDEKIGVGDDYPDGPPVNAQEAALQKGAAVEAGAPPAHIENPKNSNNWRTLTHSLCSTSNC